jgi:hypothetical protein
LILDWKDNRSTVSYETAAFKKRRKGALPSASSAVALHGWGSHLKQRSSLPGFSSVFVSDK